MECFERDAAELWLSLRIVSAFCQLSPSTSLSVADRLVLKTDGRDPSPLIDLALVLLQKSLKNAAMFDQIPWLADCPKEREEIELQRTFISTPTDWNHNICE